ncbi:MAG TPA: nuclear transport factor 2 family protein [Gammaproteobacteria bacterium]|nr:nuclear transport factor 2 family protein [Gammaproteobacteria bacterium]
MGDSHLVGEALHYRTDGSGIAAVGPFPIKAGWFAASLALVLAAGCSQQETPQLATPVIQAASQGVLPVSSDPELQYFLARLEDATNGMLNGDASLWTELASHADDATLFPPFGGVARGWEEVGVRYEAVAARRTPGSASVSVELLGSGVSGELAYVVSFQRALIRAAGSDELRPSFTRVTHILRREEGQWRLLHRHMDHLPETYTPPAQ